MSFILIRMYTFAYSSLGEYSTRLRHLCRGSRGVDAIMKGAFQRVSAHIAVDAVGGEQSFRLRFDKTIYLHSLHLPSRNHRQVLATYASRKSPPICVRP